MILPYKRLPYKRSLVRTCSLQLHDIQNSKSFKKIRLFLIEIEISGHAGALDNRASERSQQVGPAGDHAAADAVPVLHRGPLHHRHRAHLPPLHDARLGLLSIHDHQVHRLREGAEAQGE